MRLDDRGNGLPLSDGIYTPESQAYRATVTAGPAGRKLDAIAPLPYQHNDFYGVNAQIDHDMGIGTLTVMELSLGDAYPVCTQRN